ncbi:unnamed protein product [Absidia cylindrospora]
MANGLQPPYYHKVLDTFKVAKDTLCNETSGWNKTNTYYRRNTMCAIFVVGQVERLGSYWQSQASLGESFHMQELAVIKMSFQESMNSASILRKTKNVTAIIMVDGEHASHAIKANAILNKAIFADINETTSTYGRKIDLLRVM